MSLNRSNTAPSMPSPFRNFLYFFLFCSLVVYALLLGKYRLEDLDDTWSLSYVRNYVLRGIEVDPTFGGPARILYFGKTHAWFTGHFLNLIGWTRENAHLLSIFLLFVAAFLWVPILRRLSYSLPLACSFAALALLTEPFFSAAQSARPEAFVFLLCALALLFFVQSRYLLCVLTACVAVESHPMGIMAFFYVAAAALSGGRWRNILKRRSLIELLSGFLLGAAYYLWLHGTALAGLGQTVAEGNTQVGRTLNNYLYDYFFKTKYLRHLPELGLILAGVFLYGKNRFWKDNSFAWILFWVTVVSTLLLSRPNFHYALYAYPAFLLLILVVAEKKERLKAGLVLFLLLLLPQYAFVYSRNRSFDFTQQLQAVRSAVPQDSLPILGSANEWFSFMDREFYSTQYVGDYKNLKFKEAYLIEENDYREDPISMRHWIPGNFEEKTLSSQTLNGETFVIKKISRKTIP